MKWQKSFWSLVFVSFVSLVVFLPVVWSQEELPATTFEEWTKLVQSLKVECRNLREILTLISLSSGDLDKLSQSFEQRLIDYERLVTSLEESNKKLLLQSEKASQDLIALKQDLIDLKQSLDALKNRVSQLETENTVLTVISISVGVVAFGFAIAFFAK